ncbi:MAG: hypothetical protein H6Q12_12 [Bacteroidetes bacterium]|nr:hypothetical protein [Bacteroidota bacterium]
MRKFLLILLVIILASCAGTKTIYVPVQSVKTEYRDRIKTDSVHVLDSIFFAIKGDTIIKEKYRTIYKDRLLRDSIFKEDTIRVPYPVEKQVVTNKLNWFQKVCVWGFSSIIGALILYIIIWLLKKKYFKN